MGEFHIQRDFCFLSEYSPDIITKRLVKGMATLEEDAGFAKSDKLPSSILILYQKTDVFSQRTWRQSQLQVLTKESKAAWATEVFYSPGREPLAKQESKLASKMDCPPA